MIHIWFEPHSTSIDNEANLASGWNDIDLSELGQKQSIELLERSKTREISAIFCSDEDVPEVKFNITVPAFLLERK